MSDGDLIKWIRYLHAAAAVPKGDPDYEDAQAAVALAQRKIAFLNRRANREGDYTPTALETAGMTGLQSTAGAAAALPVSPVMAMMGVPPSPFNSAMEALVAKIAGDAVLKARGHDPEALDRGQGAHPTAAFMGEMTPTLLMLLAGKAGGKPAYNAGVSRLKINPAGEPIPIGRSGLPEINMDLQPSGTATMRPVRSVPDILDRPTFLRRAEKPLPPSLEPGATQFGGPPVQSTPRNAIPSQAGPANYPPHEYVHPDFWQILRDQISEAAWSRIMRGLNQRGRP